MGILNFILHFISVSIEIHMTNWYLYFCSIPITLATILIISRFGNKKGKKPKGVPYITNLILLLIFIAIEIWAFIASWKTWYVDF